MGIGFPSTPSATTMEAAGGRLHNGGKLLPIPNEDHLLINQPVYRPRLAIGIRVEPKRSQTKPQPNATFGSTLRSPEWFLTPVAICF